MADHNRLKLLYVSYRRQLLKIEQASVRMKEYTKLLVHTEI